MPSLQFINNNPGGGPQSVKLFKKITTLGADNTNDISIPDPSIDANHAYIIFDGKHYNISPVNRKSVILINGRQEKNYKLTHKDVITLGEVNLTFDLFDEIDTRTKGSAPSEMAGYHKLHEFTEKLLGQYRIEELLNSLIDMLIEITQADKGFLILKREEKGYDVTVARNINRESIEGAIGYVSDTIIARVVETRKSLLVADAMSDEFFNKSVSVMNLKLSSVMCAPIVARGNMLGVIYLGNNNVINLFTPEKMQLLEIFAAQAALIIQNAIIVNELQIDRKELQEKIEQMRFGRIIGSSDAMREVFQKISKIAGVDVPVLIMGETGTGKELVAREIHEKSMRRDGPFVAINCGAIPGELLESELFGHKRGAFTGAVANRTGKFKAADGGTLFLDEIGEIDATIQIKLLRFLGERTFERVGSNKTLSADVRLIAATNKNLEAQVKAGAFREDLYFRLRVVELRLPPLRERLEDIPLLARAFQSEFSRENEKPLKGFTTEAFDALMRYPWPGNVRELRTAIEHAVILCRGEKITLRDLPLALREAVSRTPDEKDIKRLLARQDLTSKEIERERIISALKATQGNRTQAARRLGMSRRNFHRKLHLHRIEEI